MNPTLDLNILPLFYRDGQEEANPAELYAVMPPKRPTHSREGDSLILYLSLTGNAPLLTEQQTSLMERLAQKFYKTSGSVTSAMRSLAEGLNLNLLQRNLRISGAGKQSIGQFIIAVLRGDTIFLAHCGPVHSFLISRSGTQVMHDPSGAGRGLGLAKTTAMRFYQVHIQNDDYLLLTEHAPAGWTENELPYPSRLGMEGMRRQLLDQAGAEMSRGKLSGVLIQAQAGDGTLRLLRRKTGVPDMARTSPEQAPDTQSAPDIVAASDTLDETSKPEALPDSSPPQTEIVSRNGLRRVAGMMTGESTSSQEAMKGGSAPVAEAVTAASQPARTQPERTKPERNVLRQVLTPLQASFAAVGRALGNTLESIASGMGRLARNMLPDESILHLPPSVMLFIALAIPLVIATIGGVIYIQRGKAAQYQYHYDQAVLAARNASGQTEAPTQRAAWQLVLGALDSAEFYQVTPDSQSLRNQAQEILDSLDKIERLNFQPALSQGALGEEFVIQRMVTNGNDLYLLDGIQGNVVRATMSGRGLSIDVGFRCGPAQGPLVVGKLVDIVALPTGLYEDASVLGMDARGNLLFCAPDGAQPTAVQPALPGNFVEATNLEIDNGDLYVLDPQSKAVWLYNNLRLDQLPRDFFGEDRPDSMADVIDMVINDDDLFLLHADGQVSKCVYSTLVESPTRCEEPFFYQDARAGRSSGALMEETSFEEIYFSPPPGPSIYMLDSQHQAVYYFSKRLAMQVQYRTATDLPAVPASAFAISYQHVAFLAIGDQVYYAALP